MGYDEDTTEFDIYSNSSSRSGYNTSLGREGEGGHEDSSSLQSASSLNSRGRHSGTQAKLRFVPAQRPPVATPVYSPPVVPADYEPIHRFAHDEVTLSRSIQPLARGFLQERRQLDAATRAALLGAIQLPSGPVSDQDVLPGHFAPSGQVGGQGRAPGNSQQPQLGIPGLAANSFSTEDRKKLLKSLDSSFTVYIYSYFYFPSFLFVIIFSFCLNLFVIKNHLFIYIYIYITIYLSINLYLHRLAHDSM